MDSRANKPYEIAIWQTAVEEYQKVLDGNGFAQLSTEQSMIDLETKMNIDQKDKSRHELYPILHNLNKFINHIGQLSTECTELLLDQPINAKILSGGAIGMLYMSTKSLRTLGIISDGLGMLGDDMQYFGNCKQSDTWLHQMVKVFVAILKCHGSSLSIIARYGADDFAITQVSLRDNIEKLCETVRRARDEIETGGRSDGVEKRQENDPVDVYMEVESKFGNKDPAQANFPVQNLPPLYNPFFLDRKQELMDLKTYARPGSDLDNTKMIVLEGSGGIGKSALALQLFRELTAEKVFDAIFWINAESRDTMAVSFSEIAGWIGHPRKSTDTEQNSMLALSWLRTTEKTWLLIYDNLEDIELFARYRPGGSGVMIATTRINKLNKKLEVEAIRLSRFSKTDSITAFNHFRQVRDPTAVEGAEMEEMEELVTLLDGLALGIKQIASYIGNERWSIAQYLEKYKGMPKILLSEEDSSESQTLAQAWAVEFEDLRKKRVHACQILSILSMISAHEIPMSLFLLGEDDAGVEDIYDVFEDELDVDKAFVVLETTNLIENDKKSGNIFIHRVLQVAFRYSKFGLHTPESFQEAVNATAVLLNNRFPVHVGSRSLYDQWDVCAAYLPHVHSLVSAFSSFKNRRYKLKSTPVFDELLKNCCWYLYEAGLYTEGIDLLKFATEHSTDKFGLHYATLCQAYACITFELNDLPQARYWNEECLRIRQDKLKLDDPDIANVYSNLANVLTFEGRIEEAVTNLDLATRYLSEDKESDLVYIALRTMMVGRAYFNNSDLSEAETCYRKSEELFARCGTQFLQSYLFHDQGNLERKRDNIDLALAKYESGFNLANHFSPLNPITGINAYAMGVTQLALGKFEAAEKNFEVGLKVAKYRGLKGQEARIYRKQAELYENHLGASPDQKAKIPTLKQKASEIRDELLKMNAEVVIIPPQTDEEQYDHLVCGYFR